MKRPTKIEKNTPPNIFIFIFFVFSVKTVRDYYRRRRRRGGFDRYPRRYDCESPKIIDYAFFPPETRENEFLLFPERYRSIRSTFLFMSAWEFSNVNATGDRNEKSIKTHFDTIGAHLNDAICPGVLVTFDTLFFRFVFTVFNATDYYLTFFRKYSS